MWNSSSLVFKEKAAAQGLDAIAKSELEPHQAIKLARELREKGFSSDEFRSRYGVALVPEDELARQRFTRLVELSDSHRGELQLCIVRSAAETWAQPRLRNTSHSVLLRFIPNAAGDFAETIMLAFSARDDKRLPCDRYTSEVLSKITESPSLLQVSAIAYLVDRLKELLEDNYSPTEVAKVALALVETNIEQIRNTSCRLSTDTEDLTNITITLQRFPETRAYGTSIFEHLLIVNAYKVSETAREVDRRF